jgi:DNA-binding CsgD family transcriptional regulator
VNNVAASNDEAVLWVQLLEGIAAGGERLVLETRTGARVVVLSEAEVEQLERGALPASRVAPPQLTAREHQVLACVGQGMTGAAIGARLGLATNTVAQHLSAVRRKFVVRSSAAAVIAAREAGYVV